MDAKTKLEMLEGIAYLSDGFFECKNANNMGDAADWEHKLEQATEAYYDLLFSSTTSPSSI